MARYHVRNKDGELVVGSFAELQTLYAQQFLSDDDEVRREGSERWTRAGLMPELRTAKPRPYLRGNEFAWLAALIAIASLLLFFLLRRP